MSEDKAESKNIKKWIIIFLILIIALLGYCFYNYFGFFFGLGEEPYESRFDKEVNLIIIGQDKKNDVQEGKIQSDSIILANLKPDKKELTITAVPSHKEYNGKKLQEYNRQELTDIAGNIMGVKPQYYFEIDYEGFKNIVNLMSGIEVEIKEEFRVPELGLYLKEGKNLLSGQEALNYARYYNHSKDELTRIARQQQVMRGFSDKIFQKNTILNIPKLYKTVIETIKNVNTNLDYDLAIEAYYFINNSDDFNINYEIIELDNENN